MAKPVSISKDMIDEAAFNLVRTDGIGALSVRNIARDLDCSTKPVYRTYGNMEKLREAVTEKIRLFMTSQLYSYRRTNQPLLDLGIAYVLSAKREKNLFLYLCETKKHPRLTFGGIASERLRELYTAQLGQEECPPDKLEAIATHCGLFTFGLAISCCYGIFTPTEDEIEALLLNFFNTQIKGI